jgi:predicted Rossmann fold flavoprotein
MTRVAVVGAGAAGTMAAIFAALGGAETILVEGTKDGGRKILISGGGRCNILPASIDESRFVTDSSPRTLRHIVRSWPLREQRAFFEREVDLPLVEETESAKLFPASHSGRDVRDKLLAFAQRHGVRVATGVLVTGVRRSERRWLVEQAGGAIEADAVILATGGLSVPNTGSDGRGLKIAARLDHVLHPTYPALTPLLSKGEAAGGRDVSHFPGLSGLSLPVTLTATSSRREARSTGGFLFTHHGYSGPAVLDVSHVAVRSLLESDAPAQITVQWGPLSQRDWDAVLKPRGTRSVLRALDEQLPRRLAEALAQLAGVDVEQPLSQLTRTERLRLTTVLLRAPLPWAGDEGYKKAEVTGGGVSLADIDPKSMESRRHPGLFLCGEMLDAFGPIGGYNFFWAWATGRAAGIGASRGISTKF